MWQRIGKIKEARGLAGELYVLIFSREAPWAADLKKFALSDSDQGPFQEFSVVSLREQKEGIVVKVKGLQTRTQAEALVGNLFYISKDHFVSKKGDAIFLHEILGFQVQSFQQIVGEIVDFSSNGPQDLLVVKRQDQIVEIPFVEAFLKKIDFENRQVMMELPEGLWEDT